MFKQNGRYIGYDGFTLMNWPQHCYEKEIQKWHLPLVPYEGSEFALFRVLCLLSPEHTTWLLSSDNAHLDCDVPASRTMKLKSTLIAHPWYSITAHNLTRTFGKLQGKVSELFPNALHRDEGMETMKLRLIDMNVKYSKHLELDFQKNRQKNVKATLNVKMKNMDIQNWQEYDFSYW